MQKTPPRDALSLPKRARLFESAPRDHREIGSLGNSLGCPSISDNIMVNRAALIVIDGWGERDEEYGNAIKQAATPVMDSLRAEANFAVVEASSLAVGLPEDTMGN